MFANCGLNVYSTTKALWSPAVFSTILIVRPQDSACSFPGIAMPYYGMDPMNSWDAVPVLAVSKPNPCDH